MLLTDSIKTLLGKQVKILFKNVVRLETKGDKTENRVLVSVLHLFLFDNFYLEVLYFAPLPSFLLFFIVMVIVAIDLVILLIVLTRLAVLTF